MKNKRLEKVTGTILSQSEEERCWLLYLAVVSNPFAEPVSFDEFMKRMKPENTKAKIGSFTKTSQVEKQVLKAAKILKGFKPSGQQGA